MTIRKGPRRMKEYFVQIPNAWARDERLTMRARGVLTFLESHAEDFAVTTDYIVSKTPEGRDAINTAIRELKTLGYLVRDRRRAQDGTFNGGTDLMLLDPMELDDAAQKALEEQRAKTKRKHTVRTAGSGKFAHKTGNPSDGEATPATPVDNVHKTGNPSSGEKGNLDSNSDVHKTGNQTTGNPSNVKEHQVKEDDLSQSPSVNEVSYEGESNVATDDDSLSSVEEAILQGLDPRLTMAALTARLRHGPPRNPGAIVDVDQINIVSASVEIMSRRTDRVNNPVAFIAASIENAPDAWMREDLRKRHTTASCNSSDHRWTGPWDEYCTRCESFRPGWEVDRDLYPDGIPREPERGVA